MFNRSSEYLKKIVSSCDLEKTFHVVTFKLLMGGVANRLINITKRDAHFSVFKFLNIS